jgi:hypothetical protein
VRRVWGWIGCTWILILAACSATSTATPGPAFYTALAPAFATPSATPTSPGTAASLTSAGPLPENDPNVPALTDQSEAASETATTDLERADGIPTPAPPVTGTAPAVSGTPAVTRTAAPIPTPIVPLSSVAPAQPLVYETTVTLLTYDYQAALVETGPDDPVYPYPRLDFSRVGPPAPHSYQAVVLENGYTELTILPELGGRIYRWVDKATGRHVLYENRVVKPTGWGYRGWWLAVGGIEWAFPVEEHGLNEWRPWKYSTGLTANGLSVTVTDVEDRTGMTVGVTISLDAEHAYVTIQPWVRNDTEQAHNYQLWLNAMLALGPNGVSPSTQLIIPAEQVLIHTTVDSGLPGPGETMTWPNYAGRDMSWYDNWRAYLGFFVPSVSWGFVGIYDHSIDVGLVRSFEPGWPAGTKLFGPAGLSPSVWSDDEGSYIELWSGATRTFGEDGRLEPGQSVRWFERWYAISGLGGFTFANEAGALRLVDTGGGAEVGVAVSAFTAGHLSLWAGGQLVSSWPINLYPGQVLNATWSRPAETSGDLGLRLEDKDGATLAQTGWIP